MKGQKLEYFLFIEVVLPRIRFTNGVVFPHGFVPMRARKLHACRGNVFHKSKLHLKVREMKVIGSN